MERLNIKLVSVRGATTVINNTKEEILKNTEIMIKKIIDENDINVDNIISMFFTTTKDLTKVYPAVAARSIGIVNASLMCYDELYVENSLEKCIRVMIQFYSEKNQKDIKHIYLNEAKILRPDLIKEEK